MFLDFKKFILYPRLEHYYTSKNFPFSILLLLDKCPWPSCNLDDVHPNVVFLPPNIFNQWTREWIAPSRPIIQCTFVQAVRETKSGENKEIFDVLFYLWWQKKKHCQFLGWGQGIKYEWCLEKVVLNLWTLSKVYLRAVSLKKGRMLWPWECTLEIIDNDITVVLESHALEFSSDEMVEIEARTLEQEEVKNNIETPEPRQFKLKN